MAFVCTRRLVAVPQVTTPAPCRQVTVAKKFKAIQRKNKYRPKKVNPRSLGHADSITDAYVLRSGAQSHFNCCFCCFILGCLTQLARAEKPSGQETCRRNI